VNGGKLQFALRELQDFASSMNFWIVLAAIVLLFTAIGPFGTGDHMALMPRFGFWLVNMFVGTGIAVVFVIAANIFLEPWVATPFLRMFTGSLLSCPATGFLTMLNVYSWRGPAPSWSTYLENTAQSLPIAVVFTLIFWTSMRHEKLYREQALVETAGSAVPPSADAPKESANLPKLPPEPPPLTARLKPENRGAIQRISAEDHYTLTVTSRGRELILIRFSDALSELGETVGTQIHRSHWISRACFDTLVSREGKLLARLKDGTELPVSRSFAAEVRAKIASWS
jgi:hypothetical protein